MKGNNDPASLKRALAGSLPQRIRELLSKEDMSNDDLRELVGRFFVDEYKEDLYLNLIAEADRAGINLWDNPDFRIEFKTELIKQYNRAMWRLNDSFVIIANMHGDYKARKADKDRVSLEELYGQS